MNVFFDTEFTGLHKDTTLISIGCVTEDGRTFYAELTDYDKEQLNPWLEENVIANLKFDGHKFSHIDEMGNMQICGPKDAVGACLGLWLSRLKDVQLISDVCHYDMVLLIDLFGSAFDIPGCVSPSCHDINQDIARYYEVTEKFAFDVSREGVLEDKGCAIEGDKHNALYDAQVIKQLYEIVKE